MTRSDLQQDLIQETAPRSEAPCCDARQLHILSCLARFDGNFALQGTVQHQCKLAKQVTPPSIPGKASPQPQQPSHLAAKTILDLHTALGLYGLTDSELFWELQRDTRCLLGWNNSKIVVAFRGTASVTNALSDIQVISVTHHDSL